MLQKAFPTRLGLTSLVVQDTRYISSSISSLVYQGFVLNMGFNYEHSIMEIYSKAINHLIKTYMVPVGRTKKVHIYTSSLLLVYINAVKETFS